MVENLATVDFEITNVSKRLEPYMSGRDIVCDMLVYLNPFKRNKDIQRMVVYNFVLGLRTSRLAPATTGTG